MDAETLPRAETREEKIARKAAVTAEMERRRQLKIEIFDFPVFHQDEVLPLRYGIDKEMLKVIRDRRRARGESCNKAEQKQLHEEIRAALKKYVHKEQYVIAAMIKQKRYHLDATEEYGICKQDMQSFIAYAKRYEARNAQKKEPKNEQP